MVHILNRRVLSDGGVSSEAIVWFDVVMLGLFDNVEMVTRGGNEVDGDGVSVSIILLDCDNVDDDDNELVADDADVISEDSDVKDEDAGVIVVIIVLLVDGVVVES